MGRKSTSKYDNGKRITKPPRLSAPGTRFDGTQVCICYFRCTCTLLVHLLQCSCLMWECYEVVPSGLHHLKHSGPACCCSLPAVLTSSCFWSPVSSGSFVRTAGGHSSNSASLQFIVQQPLRYIPTAKGPHMCSQVRHPGAAPNAVPWSSMEEQLLCAVVHEFGPNFAFAADVLGTCSQLQGIFRRASQCREKFKQLTVHTFVWTAHVVERHGCMFVPELHPHLVSVLGRQKQKSKERTTPFGINLTRSQVSHRAAQDVWSLLFY